MSELKELIAKAKQKNLKAVEESAPYDSQLATCNHFRRRRKFYANAK